MGDAPTRTWPRLRWVTAGDTLARVATGLPHLTLCAEISVDNTEIKKLNNQVTCRRMSFSFGYGSFQLLNNALKEAGITNKSKWAEKVLTREAKRLLG